MGLRAVCLLMGILLIPASQQQGALKKKPQMKKDVQSNTAIEELQKQISDIVSEMNLLKEKQALQMVCLRGKKIHGKCLLADSAKKNFHSASEDCINKGGTLSTPLTQHENEQFSDYLRESIGPNDKIWLGINDIQAEGVWLDLTGSTIRYKNWEASLRSPEPNGGTLKNCAVLSGAGGKWSDESCRAERASICEFKIA